MKKYITISIAVFVILAIFLSYVFSGRIILPQLFHLGPLAIRYYGLILALAAASGFYLAIKRSVLYGLDKKIAEDILFWVIVGGFIGARLYHVLSSAPYYWQHPIDIIKVWNGGLSIYGAVLGGIIIVWWLAKRYKLNAISLLDWLTPCVLLGQIIGRFGNLFNYEAFGYPTSLPWKMFVPLNFRPFAYEKFNFFHPWFLYEALGNLVILIFLLKILEPKLKKSSPGFLAFFYLLLYNCLRFGLEFLRIDSTILGIFRLNAIVSLIFVLVSVSVLTVIDKNEQKLKK